MSATSDLNFRENCPAKRLKLSVNDEIAHPTLNTDEINTSNEVLVQSLLINRCYNGSNSSRSSGQTSEIKESGTDGGGDSGFSDLQLAQNSDSTNQLFTLSECATDEQSNDESESDDHDDVDDCASTVSSLSGLSDISDMEMTWNPNAGPMTWIHRQMESGGDPRELLNRLMPSIAEQVPPGASSITLWRLIMAIVSEPVRRDKIESFNTMADVVEQINKASKIMIVTGAGVSVSCGIPDFRSRDGIYARLARDFPDLTDPQQMFDIHYFRKDPRPFFKFAKEIYPGQFRPSLCHRFIRAIELKEKLLRNYTQNIDTLEQVAGIKNVIQCHGSFATASCTRCGTKVNSDDIKDDVFNQTLPFCKVCGSEQVLPIASDSSLPLVDSPPMAVMKPDIVFFGEGLGSEFHTAISQDKSECDLLIVIGSSLKVRPVALIPSSVPATTPQVLINREPLPHMTFDVELLGDCDVIVRHLCQLLGWEEVIADADSGEATAPQLVETVLESKTDLPGDGQYGFVPPSRYVFRGAEIEVRPTVETEGLFDLSDGLEVDEAGLVTEAIEEQDISAGEVAVDRKFEN